jgi:magnesium transporter
MRKEIKYKGINWVDIQQPDENDVKFLRTSFKFHPVVLSEIIPPSFFPQVKLFNKNYIYLVIYYPVFDKAKRETKPRELDILITKNSVLTSHYQTILPLQSIFDEAALYEDKSKKYLGQGTAFLLFYILESITKNCIIKINRIEQKINEVEGEIFKNKDKNKERELVQEISILKRDILDFHRIIWPQKKVFQELPVIADEFWGKEIGPYFSEVSGIFTIIWTQLETFKDTIANLEETNNSILSTKINEVMKILTIFSVIMLPLTFISSLFGMNLDFLPFAENPFCFPFLVFLMLLLSFSMIFYFKKKKWL